MDFNGCSAAMDPITRWIQHGFRSPLVDHFQLAGGVTGGASYSLTASGARIDATTRDELVYVWCLTVETCRNYVFNDV